MSRLKLAATLLAAAALAAALAFRGAIFDYFSPQLQTVERAALNAALRGIEKQVSAPLPLRQPAGAAPAHTSRLDAPGIVKWTNEERRNNGLPPLAANASLDGVASRRLKDMFQKQYFAHVSPSGESVTTVAQGAGYDYIALGENLALGNFAGDEGVVEAWMGSPGHRANILNARYKEIGAAAESGIFDGEPTWIAVQIFGRPASDCPAASQSLKSQIEAGESSLDSMKSELDALKSEMDAAGAEGDKGAYNAEVRTYNDLAARYNALLKEIGTMIGEYNAEVSAFNQCASG